MKPGDNNSCLLPVALSLFVTNMRDALCVSCRIKMMTRHEGQADTLCYLVNADESLHRMSGWLAMCMFISTNTQVVATATSARAHAERADQDLQHHIHC